MQAMFVSSTFKDMQGERDALHRLVMPNLREKAKEYAQGVQFVDLRWGISTADCDSDDGAGKILEVCLDEIRQCKPYMIVLLGQRYGWMPSPALLESTASEKDFALDNFEMSVTELEIRYGMYMATGQLDRCIFCLRDDFPEDALPEHLRQVYLADNAEDRKRMETLRRRICDTPGVHVLHYHLEWDTQKQELTGYDRFAEILEEKLQSILLPSWQQYRSLSWQQKQRQEDQLLTTMYQDSFVGREREQEELMAQIDRHRVVILEGEGGCGKSALMAQLLKRYQQRGVQAELFFCGNSNRCMSAGQLTELLLWQMCQFWGKRLVEEAGSAQKKKAYKQVMATYDGPRVVLFIDAIDQLTPDAELYRSVFVPGKISEKITLVISTTGAVRVEPTALPAGKDASVVCKLTPPDKEELRQILHARFRAEHKQISNELADKLLANPTSQNMLGMELMVRQLVMLDQEDFAKIAALEQTMDGDAAINKYLMELAEGFSTDLERRINEYITAVCRFVDRDEIEIILFYIYMVALLQHGMSMEQMESFVAFIRTTRAVDHENTMVRSLSNWSQMRFSRLSRYMGNLLIRRSDGRIDFSHRLLREAMGNRDNVDNLSAGLVGWLAGLPMAEQAVLENIVVLLRRYYRSQKLWHENYRCEPAILDLLTEHIKAAGTRLESKDPAEKREGYRRLEILKRSVLWDLSGSSGQEHLNDYCELLDAVIAGGGSPNHFVVWFFGTVIQSEWMGRTEKDKAMGLQILCRLTASLQKRWDEDAAQGKRWTESQNKVLLQYYVSAMKIIDQLRFSNSLGLVEFGNFYGWSQEKLAEQGIALAEHAIREAPGSCQICGNSAFAYCYGVKVLLGIRVKKKNLIPYVDKAVEYAERMLGMTRSLPEKQRWVGHYVHIMAICLDSMLDLRTTMVFSTKKLTMQMAAVCQKTWDVIRQGENREQLSAENLLRFALAWNRYQASLIYKFSADEMRIHREAANVLGEIYYGLRKDANRAFNKNERYLLAKLGAELGYHLLYGMVPDAMKADGFNSYTAKRFVAEKEGGYLQAQAENGFEYRYAWTLMLVLESGVYDGKDCARAIATAKRGEAELIRLRQEWKKGSYGMYDTVTLEKLQEYLQRVIAGNQQKPEEKK